MSLIVLMFNCLTKEPYPQYYSFVAFNELYKLENQVDVSFEQAGVYAVGAVKDKKGCLVIANTTESEIDLQIAANAKVEKVYNAIDVQNKEVSLSELPAFSVVVVEFSL